jgi:hypothetical protein
VPQHRSLNLARTFAVGLGVARVAACSVEVVAPGWFLRRIGRPEADTPSARQGFRMKGGRDVALGLCTLAAAGTGDDDALRAWTATAVLVDAVDGAAVHLDRGRSMRAPISGGGAWLGYAVAAGAAGAVWVLGREARRA